MNVDGCCGRGGFPVTFIGQCRVWDEMVNPNMKTGPKFIGNGSVGSRKPKTQFETNQMKIPLHKSQLNLRTVSNYFSCFSHLFYIYIYISGFLIPRFALTPRPFFNQPDASPGVGHRGTSGAPRHLQAPDGAAAETAGTC